MSQEESGLVGRMTMISQDEIVSNAKTVTKGLEALRQEHQAILGGIRTSLGAVDLGPEGENSLITEKCALMERSLEMIELGLGEAHVMAALATHLQATEAEKQKLRSQVDPKTFQKIFQKPKNFSIIRGGTESLFL